MLCHKRIGIGDKPSTTVTALWMFRHKVSGFRATEDSRLKLLFDGTAPQRLPPDMSTRRRKAGDGDMLSSPLCVPRVPAHRPF